MRLNAALNAVDRRPSNTAIFIETLRATAIVARRSAIGLDCFRRTPLRVVSLR